MDTRHPPPLPSDDLAALIGSRLCHDLISPLGGIGNGVELLALSGAAGPEMALIAESVRSANARIRFFRLAFGAAEGGQTVGRGEILSILGDMAHGGRLAIDWQPQGPVPRPEAKLAFLGLLCLETALPYGGRITVGTAGPAWTLCARGDRLKADPALWSRLAGDTPAGPLSAAHVQFALVAAEAHRRTRRLAVLTGADTITLGF
ncbi:MAG: histidine phosphotransferase [Proteobacteria bacterium]|nr:histidine phosphotransferase [Pseudomonadota bacterium]MBS0573916.1 histidine phosphotransferase [Pseudomonadota bacterium]